MREFYKAHRFSPASEEFLTHVSGILDDYGDQGFVLTVRQLYYQIVSRDLFPNDRRWTWRGDKHKWVRDPDGTKNADPNYKWLGGILSNARLAGLLDWGMIEDRGRQPQKLPNWASPSSIVDACASQFRIDKWDSQDNYVEVWVEKDALSGVLLPVCQKLDVSFTANRGYSSLSAMHDAAKRCLSMLDGGKDVTIIYLGDHDPSGLDMTRDIVDRLGMFVGEERVEVVRAALNSDQVEEYDPPPNPAKTTDSRFKVYVAAYGTESWELDALEPSVLQGLVSGHVLALRDEAAWGEAVEEEMAGRKRLRKAASELAGEVTGGRE